MLALFLKLKFWYDSQYKFIQNQRMVKYCSYVFPWDRADLAQMNTGNQWNVFKFKASAQNLISVRLRFTDHWRRFEAVYHHHTSSTAVNESNVLKHVWWYCSVRNVVWEHHMHKIMLSVHELHLKHSLESLKQIWPCFMRQMIFINPVTQINPRKVKQGGKYLKYVTLDHKTSHKGPFFLMYGLLW